MNAKLLAAPALISILAFAHAPPWKDRPVLDTTASPLAVLHGAPVSAVSVKDGFWSPPRNAVPSELARGDGLKCQKDSSALVAG